jgi:hypothetical protein
MTMTMRGPFDPEDLRNLPTSECAIRLLRSFKDAPQVNAGNTLIGARQAYAFNSEPDVDDLLNRLSDAWAWLESHGYLGPHPSQSGDWRRITERGLAAASGQFSETSLVANDLLAPKLHQQLELNVRPILRSATSGTPHSPP